MEEEAASSLWMVSIFYLKNDRNELHLLAVKELKMMFMGLRSLLMVGEKKHFGIVATRLDDGGVVGGARTVEGILILLLVEFVGILASAIMRPVLLEICSSWRPLALRWWS